METPVDLVNALKALDLKPTEAKKLGAAAVAKLGETAPLGALVKEALRLHVGGAAQIIHTQEPEPEPEPEVDWAEEEEEDYEDPEHPAVRRPSPRRTLPVDPPRHRKARMHWRYFVLLGWWLGCVVLFLRFLLSAVETIYETEAKRESDLTAIFGWW